MKSAFITGSTGFVGKNLLKSLVKDTELKKFYLLVRDIEKAKKELSKIIEEAEKIDKKIILFNGDITKKNLGFSAKEIHSIKNVEEIYHLAANISISKKDRYNTLKVNLDGTINLFNMIKDFNNQKNIYYFGTGYVCGKGKQIVKEEWITDKKEFRNPYEESKYLAERFINEFTDGYNIPVTIIRPTIIGTDNKLKYKELIHQTIYYYANVLRKAISLQNNRESIRLIGRSDVTFNLITIEDLIKILIKIRTLKQKSQIYNLASKSNFSVIAYLEGIKDAIGFDSEYKFVDSIHFNNPTTTEDFINRKTENYFEYDLDSHIQLNVQNSEEIRKELNIKDRDNVWIKKHIKDFLLSTKNEFIEKI